ncbi:MAG: PorP/SprF family type IX secretion system membrane protein [Crocinitomicaceae bacterium]|nr:PorP/SprF family type IX secretion system membrane protein [Crocinitomicaceae bacterium]MDG1659707.1 PorP/SprF family type IX secretion system membrane protein [Crocinitomicaceae bacterium]MDG2440364.1 PorP/SprF family type IX secretion system membrane protein [Crocinitomicaceae bacterium]
MKKLVCYILLGMMSGSVHSQDLEFTQFYSNPIYLNPALAGTNQCPRFAMNYRNQWPSLTGSYVSYAAAYDNYFENINGGIGILAVHDVQAKTINSSQLGVMYSYHIQLNRKWTWLLGAKANYWQKFLDWDKLTFGDMIDPRRGFIYQTGDVPRGGSRGFFDASAGTVLFNKNFNVGFAAHHLNRPNESMIVGESKLPMRFTGHMSAYIALGQKSQYKNKTVIMPSVIYTYQNGFQQLNLGTYVKYGAFTVGTWLRNQDAFILTIGVDTKKFKIGYSYDVTVSKLNNGVSGGAHEISLGFNLNCTNRPATFRTISCPSF